MPLSFSIRPMAAADAARVAEIQVRGWQTAYRGIVPDGYLDAMDLKERTEKWQWIIERNDSTNLVIEDGAGEVLGWSSWGACRDDDKDPAVTAELWAIYLWPAARGQGYGRELWRENLRQIATTPAREVTLWVLEGNLSGRRFYEMAGFRAEPGSRKALERLGGIAELRYYREMP